LRIENARKPEKTHENPRKQKNKMVELGKQSHEVNYDDARWS
jgi:hypothetical protein